MYALPEGVVVRRRKSLFIPVALLLAGAAMIVLNNVYGAELTNNLRSSIVFIGGVLALAGLSMTAVRLFSSEGVPFHKGAKCFLHYDELYFAHGTGRDVAQFVEEGNVAQLLDMKHTNVPSVTVALYRTPDNTFAAMQAFEYTDLEYRPLTPLKIVAGRG